MTHWKNNVRFVFLNIIAVYLMLWAFSLLAFDFMEIYNPKIYQEYLDYTVNNSAGLKIFFQEQKNFLYITLPFFSIPIGLGVSLLRFSLRKI